MDQRKHLYKSKLEQKTISVLSKELIENQLPDLRTEPNSVYQFLGWNELFITPVLW